MNQVPVQHLHNYANLLDWHVNYLCKQVLKYSAMVSSGRLNPEDQNH
jgi:hypothetical protein